MSLVNDLKKLLFGAKAVTKSAAGKAAGAGKEAAGEFTEKASELWDTARHKADEVTEKVIESTDNFFDKVSDKAEDFGEAAKETASDVFEELRRFTQGDAAEPAKPAQEDTPASFSSADWPQDPASPEAPPSRVEELGKTVLDTAEKVGAKVMEHGGEVMDKVMNTAEKLGEKILEKSEGVGEKVLHVAEDLGGKIMEKGGETLERAKSLGDDIFQKASELMEKAQEEAAKESMDDAIRRAEELGQDASRKAGSTQFSDKPIDTKDSLLDKHEGFFERAARFADGDYSSKPGEPVISRDPNYEAPKQEGTVSGFFDLDGDGNEIIDDAIIDHGDDDPRP